MNHPQSSEDAQPSDALGPQEDISPEMEQALEAATSGAQDVDDDAETDHEEQLAALNDQLLRAVAETENVRRRAQRDLEESNKYAVTGFARSLVAVLENLQRATDSVSDEARAENEQLKNLAEGVDMTQRELLSVFEKHGIKRIDPIGEKFDHNFHQAMTQLEDPEAEPGTILQVLQAGYRIHDRLLQPALVAVAKRGEAQKQVDTEA